MGGGLWVGWLVVGRLVGRLVGWWIGGLLDGWLGWVLVI